MDNKFTELIKQWLDTPADERDYAVGALYLLNLSGNQIVCQNIISHIDPNMTLLSINVKRIILKNELS